MPHPVLGAAAFSGLYVVTAERSSAHRALVEEYQETQRALAEVIRSQLTLPPPADGIETPLELDRHLTPQARAKIDREMKKQNELRLALRVEGYTGGARAHLITGAHILPKELEGPSQSTGE